MKFLDKISVSKEILENMPKNNKKNKVSYKKNIEELKDEYINIKNELFNEIKRRYSEKTEKFVLNPEINNSKRLLEQMGDSLYLVNSIKTAYEKMGIDENIWRLRKFYKDNLENVNNEILQCINAFSVVGINLTAKDFNYNKFTQAYMNVFFEEIEDITSKKLKETFENIYWKCPELITHLELNIRYLYLQNESKTEKYYTQAKFDILKGNDTEQDVFNRYLELKDNLQNMLDTSPKLILDKFLNKEVNYKDYLPNKIQKEYAKIIDIELLQEDDEIKDNILKFYNNICEFKNYLKFKFIFEDIKKHYLEKDRNKKTYDDLLKKIRTEEKKLSKLNDEKTKKFFLFKKKNDDINIQYADLIKNIQDMYKQLDKEKVYNKISEYINDNSTIYDVFKFANSFKPYVRDIAIENIPTIMPEEIDELIIDFDRFVKTPNIQIINNILIQETKNISLIIKDRYALLKFNITKEDVQEDNIDTLYQILKKLKFDINLEKANMDINKISEIIELYEIIK